MPILRTTTRAMTSVVAAGTDSARHREGGGSDSARQRELSGAALGKIFAERCPDYLPAYSAAEAFEYESVYEMFGVEWSAGELYRGILVLYCIDAAATLRCLSDTGVWLMHRHGQPHAKLPDAQRRHAG